ncbi:Inactive tyrosine-protein kinase kin-32 [Trichostrongylus colubriformis]|uniref:Inactive tyrosine-protein kinase kin-32 n=1 Tax=Trichostrongylus colubriformis TaxID=6319 RepID=A0AAN8G3E4_TRICO
MDCIARVFTVGNGCKAVRYDDETTVERVLQVVLQGIGIAAVAHAHFALRLLSGPSPRTAGDHVWLHPYLLISNLRHTYAKFLPASTCPQDLNFELRLRFIPQSAYELLLTESNAFFYLNEQVFEDFLGHVAWKVDLDAALELAALKVCRDCLEKQVKSCLDHKIDIDAINMDSAIQAFIPKSVLCGGNIKPSTLRRQFGQLLKKFSSLSPTESVLRSLSILIDIVKFDVEIFKASMGVGWSSPVDLLVGPEVGLSYRINERCESSRLAELRSVLEIVIKKMEQGSEKAIVQLKISGSAQPMLITVATHDIAESLAHLIDGYQIMYNQGSSVFKKKGLERCESADLRATALYRSQPSTSVAGNDARIKREYVTLKELIGGGQFGNVYRGTLANPGSLPITVAVKVCKMENEPTDTQLILQESHLMRNLRHDNIISLIGVCMDAPMWLVMELAPLGELRQYLQSNRASLSLTSLILYSLQVARALSYLHERSLVHRDIAARNVLVSTPKCVKLTDFGLSRALDYDAIYTASRGKLPIKWLAPESINYREFSMASDIWMYGVCVWEILSWGAKPWQGVANADVITRVESGERLPCPDGCPAVVFNYLELMVWALQPQKRPTAKEIVMVMESLHEQLKKHVQVEELHLIRPSPSVPVLLTNISTLPNLTLWRTLEEQKRQCEEDDKWLEEQEDLVSYDPSEEQNRIHNGFEASTSRACSNGSLDGKTTDGRASPSLTPISQAVSSITDAVERLANAFNTNMKHDEFFSSIRDITSRLREMFVESTELLSRMPEERRKEVELTESLIGNDMRQMGKVVQQVVDNINNPSYHVYRREVVRIAKELATNCTNFLSLFEKRNRAQLPDFRAVLSDC